MALRSSTDRAGVIRWVFVCCLAHCLVHIIECALPSKLIQIGLPSHSLVQIACCELSRESFCHGARLGTANDKWHLCDSVLVLEAGLDFTCELPPSVL